MKSVLTLAAACLAAAIAPAAASSDDAWDEFRRAVEEACLVAAAPLIEAPEAVVDPFGSQSYGLALVRGKAVGADGPVAAICVHDKQTGTTEIGGELPIDMRP